MNDKTLNVIDLDISNKQLITLSQAASLLGLRYHHARKLLYSDQSIGYYDYNSKRLWDIVDIINYRDRHFIQPRIA